MKPQPAKKEPHTYREPEYCAGCETMVLRGRSARGASEFLILELKLGQATRRDRFDGTDAFDRALLAGYIFLKSWQDLRIFVIRDGDGIARWIGTRDDEGFVEAGGEK